MLADGFLNRRGQRAGVADAGGTAVGDDAEAERFEVAEQAGLAQVFGDHARARRQRGLDPRPDAQAARHGLLGQQPGGEHHAGVGGVGAGGDGRDQHVAVADVAGLRHRRQGMPPRQLVGRLAVAVLAGRQGEQAGEGAPQFGQLDVILRPLGAGDAGTHRGEVDFDDFAVVDVAAARHAEHPLRLEIARESGHFLVAASGGSEVGDGLFVDGEETHGGAVFRRHVGQRRAVGHAQGRRALAEELDELADHAGLAQAFGDEQHQVGGGGAFGQAALELDADHVGRQEIERLPEHAGLGLDAADAQRVDHGGVRIGADQRVGVGDAVLPDHAAGQVFEVDLVHDADARRHHAEGVEGLHAPLDEAVALQVALEFDAHVQIERVFDVVVVDLHRVVDHQVDRHQRLDDLRIAALLLGHAAHGGQVAQQRYAGEVLQDDARDDERNLAGALGRRLPAGEFAHVLLGDAAAIAVAQQGFEHDAQGNGEPRNLAQSGRFERGERVEPGGLRGGNAEFPQSAKRVVRHGGLRA